MKFFTAITIFASLVAAVPEGWGKEPVKTTCMAKTVTSTKTTSVPVVITTYKPTTTTVKSVMTTCSTIKWEEHKEEKHW